VDDIVEFGFDRFSYWICATMVSLVVACIKNKGEKMEQNKLECNGCGNPIEIGVEHINLSLSVEKENKNGVFSVLGDALSLVTYHLGCYPDIKKNYKQKGV